MKFELIDFLFQKLAVGPFHCWQFTKDIVDVLIGYLLEIGMIMAQHHKAHSYNLGVHVYVQVYRLH